MALSTSYLIIPTTTAPYQSISVTLNQQLCAINLYTKSLMVPVSQADAIATDPNPQYVNQNPVFLDLFINGSTTPVIGGVMVRAGWLVVRDTYLGFSGDLSVLDMSGAGEDPYGVPPRLPPLHLRNLGQLAQFPLALGNQAPPSVAGQIPGMGSRWQLTYWPPGTYTPGYPPRMAVTTLAVTIPATGITLIPGPGITILEYGTSLIAMATTTVAAGQILGTFAVEPRTWSGQLSLGGAGAADFKLVGFELEASRTIPVGSLLSLSVTATP